MLLRSRKHTALISKRQHQIWILRFLVVVLVMLTSCLVNLEWKEPTRLTMTTIDSAAILAEMGTRSSTSTIYTDELFDDVSSDQNARAVSEQRSQLETLCRHADDRDFAHGLAAIFQPPTVPVNPKVTTIQPCQRVFWDLGANIGDTVYKFVNAGFYHLPCHTSFHLDTGRLVQSYVSDIDPRPGRWSWLFSWKWINGAHWEGIYDWADSRMKEATRQTRPEDYCYVGVEGNPALTKRLQRLASRTMNTTPRPLRSLAFLTETVITDENGPVEMFLEGDVGQGSTILAEKSKRSRHNHGIAVVRGITLATLLEETVAMTDDSHLIIKMDVEGAEYAILNKDWQTLCRAVQENKLHISLLLELHGRRKIGRNSALASFHRDKIVRKLANCGVHIVMDSMRFPGWGRVYRSVTT